MYKAAIVSGALECKERIKNTKNHHQQIFANTIFEVYEINKALLILILEFGDDISFYGHKMKVTIAKAYNEHSYVYDFSEPNIWNGLGKVGLVI